MEIQTTVKELPEKMRKMGFSSETSIRVIVEEPPKKGHPKRSHFPFLDGPVWDQEGPNDISENIDHYLYEADNIHGE